MYFGDLMSRKYQSSLLVLRAIYDSHCVLLSAQKTRIDIVSIKVFSIIIFLLSSCLLRICSSISKVLARSKVGMVSVCQWKISRPFSLAKYILWHSYGNWASLLFRYFKPRKLESHYFLTQILGYEDEAEMLALYCTKAHTVVLSSSWLSSF